MKEAGARDEVFHSPVVRLGAHRGFRSATTRQLPFFCTRTDIPRIAHQGHRKEARSNTQSYFPPLNLIGISHFPDLGRIEVRGPYLTLCRPPSRDGARPRSEET